MPIRPKESRFCICARCGENVKYHAKDMCKACYQRSLWLAKSTAPRRLHAPAREGLVKISCQFPWTLNDALVALADRHGITKSLVINIVLLDAMQYRPAEMERVVATTVLETLRKVPVLPMLAATSTPPLLTSDSGPLSDVRKGGSR